MRLKRSSSTPETGSGRKRGDFSQICNKAVQHYEKLWLLRDIRSVCQLPRPLQKPPLLLLYATFWLKIISSSVTSLWAAQSMLSTVIPELNNASHPEILKDWFKETADVLSCLHAEVKNLTPFYQFTLQETFQRTPRFLFNTSSLLIQMHAQPGDNKTL